MRSWSNSHDESLNASVEARIGELLTHEEAEEGIDRNVINSVMDLPLDRFS
jgi:hypothetical protein